MIVLLSSISTQSHSEIFVTPVLNSSRAYYKNEGLTLSTELDSSAYLRKIDARLTEEGERSDVVLGSGLKGSLLRVVLDEMVVGYVEAIAEKGQYREY